MISQKLQWQSTAKEQLDKFYADRAEKLEKNKSLNRENADALRVDQEQFNPAEGKDDAKKWEMVTQRIDFNAKGNYFFHRHMFIPFSQKKTLQARRCCL